MDNASKALIMAGAILISIAIVGVGVFIFSSTSSITNSGQQQIDAAAAQMANSTLRQYSGPRVRGSTVIDFIEYTKVLNKNNTFPTEIKAQEGSVAVTSIVSNKFYNVSLTDSDNDGYYDEYKVDNVTSGT